MKNEKQNISWVLTQASADEDEFSELLSPASP